MRKNLNLNGKVPLRYCTPLNLRSFVLQSRNIPRGADRIEVATSLTDSVLFDSIQSYLDSENYIIDKSDTKRGSLITQYKNAKGLTQIRVLVNIKNSIATFRGQGAAEAMGFKYNNEPLLNKGMASGLVKGGFLVLNDVVVKFASKTEGSTVRYLMPE